MKVSVVTGSKSMCFMSCNPRPASGKVLRSGSEIYGEFLMFNSYPLPTINYLLPTKYVSYNSFLRFFKKRVVITALHLDRGMNSKFQVTAYSKREISILEQFP